MGEWTGPIASAYGAHLIFISERTPGEVPPLTRVANKLRLQLEEQRRDANLNILLAELRTQYRVVVERIPEPIDALYSQEPG
jgi:parvulin-like peptidyl-prolyl isomerase